MFGKRDKNTINSKQNSKIRVLLRNKNIPFVIADPRLG